MLAVNYIKVEVSAGLKRSQVYGSIKTSRLERIELIRFLEGREP
jgi:hypothetical protein